MKKLDSKINFIKFSTTLNVFIIILYFYRFSHFTIFSFIFAVFFNFVVYLKGGLTRFFLNRLTVIFSQFHLEKMIGILVATHHSMTLLLVKYKTDFSSKNERRMRYKLFCYAPKKKKHKMKSYFFCLISLDLSASFPGTSVNILELMFIF